MAISSAHGLTFVTRLLQCPTTGGGRAHCSSQRQIGWRTVSWSLVRGWTVILLWISRDMHKLSATVTYLAAILFAAVAQSALSQSQANPTLLGLSAS